MHLEKLTGPMTFTTQILRKMFVDVAISTLLQNLIVWFEATSPRTSMIFYTSNKPQNSSLVHTFQRKRAKTRGLRFTTIVYMFNYSPWRTRMEIHVTRSKCPLALVTWLELRAAASYCLNCPRLSLMQLQGSHRSASLTQMSPPSVPQ